jgi:hypothetical protein
MSIVNIIWNNPTSLHLYINLAVMHYYISQIQASPPGPTPRLSTIFENMRQIPGGGHKKREIAPQQGKKSVSNPDLPTLTIPPCVTRFLYISHGLTILTHFSHDFNSLFYFLQFTLSPLL